VLEKTYMYGTTVIWRDFLAKVERKRGRAARARSGGRGAEGDRSGAAAPVERR